MQLFDSHCHLDDEAFAGDWDAVVERLRAAGVAGVMIVGTTLERCRRAVALAEAHQGFFAAVGIHPHDARECNENTLQKLVELAARPCVRAWGEIGLDFNRMFSPRKDQEKWCRRQLTTAVALKKPLIFHERDSGGRLLEILRLELPPGNSGVIHCFSGTRAELEQYLDLGLCVGITGIITMQSRGADLRELAPLIPAERIVVETDAPYLTPVPERNRLRRNEPAFVRSVLLKLAEVRQEDPEDLAARVWANTCRLYHLAV